LTYGYKVEVRFLCQFEYSFSPRTIGKGMSKTESK
jgi:hypothetical protein